MGKIDACQSTNGKPKPPSQQISLDKVSVQFQLHLNYSVLQFFYNVHAYLCNSKIRYFQCSICG